MTVIVAALSLVIGAAQIHGFHGLRHDDAFISYRYGQNLAEGHGLVFNRGQRVMGFTSPGHVLLSAVFYRLVGREALPSVMSAIGCLAWLAQAIALTFILMRALDWGAIFIGLFVAAGAAWSHRFVALETNLVAALVLVAVALALADRWWGAAIVCAIAGVFRPDAYLVGLLLLIECVRQTGRRAIGPFLLALALSAVWPVFALDYFGKVLPQSATSKVGTVRPLEYLQILINYPALNVIARRLSLPSEAPGPTAALVWLVTGAGAALLVHRDRRLWILPATAGLYASAYLGLRAFVGYEWHLYPVLLLTTVLAASLTVALVTAFSVRRPFVGAVLLSVVVIVLAYRTHAYSHLYRHALWYGARDESYRNVGRFLEQNAGPMDVVIAGEVGTIAYYSRLDVADWAELVNPSMKEALAATAQRTRWQIMVSAYDVIPADPTKEFSSEELVDGELTLPGKTNWTTSVFRLPPNAALRTP